jgi:dienelactone hydrolase
VTSSSATEITVAATTIALTALVAVKGSLPGSIGLLVVVVLAGAGCLLAQRRLGRAASASAALGLGLAGLVGGLGIGVSHLVSDPRSAGAILGTMTLSGGLLLVVLASVRLIGMLAGWRKLLGLPVGIALLTLAVGPVTLAVFVTQAPSFPATEATPADHGLRYDDVELLTADHVRLDGQYVTSTNGAAVIVLGGISGIGSHEVEIAAVLARHGYGVLLLNARGQGRSQGSAMLWGWWGEVDVAAGVDYLSRRPDVVDGRIGAVGMSVGGEQVIAAAGRDPRLRAVVSEGATARGARDEGDPARGLGGLLIRYVDQVSRRAAELMTSAASPTPLRRALAAFEDDQRALLIAAGTAPPEIAAADAFRATAPGHVETWIAPGASHTGAFQLHPDAWERRVAGFLDDVLAPHGTAQPPA